MVARLRPRSLVRLPVVWSGGCESRDNFERSRDAWEAGRAMASRNLLAATEFQVADTDLGGTGEDTRQM